jgi:transposase
LAQDLGVDFKVVTRVYQRLREALYHLAELAGGKLKGEIELDDAYFGGRRKGKRGTSRRWYKWRLWAPEREHRVYTKVVESVSA